jgi:hypothetical protein
MKLVPFFLQKKETPLLHVYRFTVFLSDGGKTLWEIGDERDTSVILHEYLQENGLMSHEVRLWKNIYFAKVDPLETNKNSFYTWEEIQEIPEKRREECFRTFVFCFEKNEGKLWFHSEVNEHPFEGTEETPSTIFQGLKNIYYKEV